MTAQEMLAQLAALLDKRDIEIESLSSQLSTAKADIRHALKEARRRQPDYPWSENTASEAIWCLGEAYGGTKAACDDLHAEIRDLRSQLAAAQAENAALRDRAANQHCAELLREVKATGERNAEPEGQRFGGFCNLNRDGSPYQVDFTRRWEDQRPCIVTVLDDPPPESEKSPTVAWIESVVDELCAGPIKAQTIREAILKHAPTSAVE